jgi:hypothetical protein
MNVIAFKPKSSEWHQSELDSLLDVLSPVFSLHGASGWDVDHTEAQDPQFYLLGPKPEQECILCVSRVGHIYIVSDGEGRHIVDVGNVEALSGHVQGLLNRCGARTLAKLTLIWCAARQAFHDKIEPLLTDSDEVLVHFAPQLAALA